MEAPSTLTTATYQEGKTKSEDSACQKDGRGGRTNSASDAVGGPYVPVVNTDKAHTAEVRQEVTRQTDNAFTIQHILRQRQLQTLPPNLDQHAGVPPAKTENLSQSLH
ncbi:hypothetical protein Esti_006263 [Eimeria stiedai]